MSDARIPFAIRKADQSMVEVSDVKRGQQCGCVCPSCKQGVIARQGDVYVWHFSHDQNAHDKPIKACDISFYSCCRQYVIELLLKGEITQLRTPEYIISEPCNTGAGNEWTAVVTGSHTFEDITVKTIIKSDVEIGIGHHNFQLFFSYPGRVLPNCPDDKKIGLLIIDIRTIKSDFYSQNTSPSLLKNLLTNLLSNETRSRHWLFHPREETVRSKLREQVKIDPKYHASEASDIGIHAVKNKLAHSPRQNPINILTQYYGKYRCLNCGMAWQGRKDVDSHCPKCNEYLHSSFTAD